MTINIFMYIYIGENSHWDIYAPPLANHYTKFFSNFCYFFFHFRCILLQISHKKCFFISISILGRSGVKSQFFFCKSRIIVYIFHLQCLVVTILYVALFMYIVKVLFRFI